MTTDALDTSKPEEQDSVVTEDKKKKKPAKQPNTGSKKTPRGMNSGALSGIIESSELKKSGSFEIMVNTDPNRMDQPIKGAGVTSFFTSSIFARIPKPVVDRVGRESFEEGAHIILAYSLVGVKRVIEGKPYNIVEIRAKDVIPSPAQVQKPA